MTKKDAKAIGWALLLAGGIGGLIYWFGIRKRLIADVAPSDVIWTK